MRISFEKEDAYVIAQAIAEENELFGKIFVDIDGIEFEVDYEKSWEGYQEENTGAWVTTDACVRLCNLQCGDIKLSYDEREIERAALSFMGL